MITYTIRDFYLSSYLIAAGIQLKSYHKTNGITTFEFDNSDKLHNLIHKYYSMTPSVEPMAYRAAIKNLKSVIHSTNTHPKSNFRNETERRNL